MVYSYINKQSFAISLLLLGPWAKDVEIKARTTNGFRCNTREHRVMQLFHIFSNPKPGEKALCSRMWHPGITLFTELKHLPRFSWIKHKEPREQFLPPSMTCVITNRTGHGAGWGRAAPRAPVMMETPLGSGRKGGEPCHTQHWDSITLSYVFGKCLGLELLQKAGAPQWAAVLHPFEACLEKSCHKEPLKEGRHH